MQINYIPLHCYSSTLYTPTMIHHRPTQTISMLMGILFLVFSTSTLPAHHRTTFLQITQQAISGQVTDGETGDPLPGVNVLAKGTSSGTVTDIEGSYRLTVDDEVTTLVFSSIGYVSQEVEINGQTAIDLTLATDIQALSEVVVIGYGTQKKSDLTGAVTSVKAETLQERPAASLNQSLAGRMTGVNVSTNSGRPGGKNQYTYPRETPR